MVMVMMMTRRIGQAATDQMHAVCHALPCHAVLCWLELRFPAGLLGRDHTDCSASSDPSSLVIQHHRRGVSANTDMQLPWHTGFSRRCGSWIQRRPFLILQSTADLTRAGF